MAIIEIKRYQTSDGTVFASEQAAREHETLSVFTLEVQKYVDSLVTSGQHSSVDHGAVCWYKEDLIAAMLATRDQLVDLVSHLET